MPFTNVSVPQLDSYQPAIDYRKTGKIGVLAGKNFAWDASGVYSAFASRLVSGSASIGEAPGIAQELDFGQAVHVASGNKIHLLTPLSEYSNVGSWSEVAVLDGLVYADPLEVPYNYRKWYTTYIGSNHYACAYNYGVFRVNIIAGTYTRLTSVDVAGFPGDETPVIAIAESNGRMIYMTKLAIFWSGPNDGEDLTPALGGAGFQVIGEKIAGEPFAITPTGAGAVVWTSSGALAMEFIGGDTVWRWYQLETKALPLSAFAVARLPDDEYAILTRLGLFSLSNLNQPQLIAPLFGEFLREYLRSRPAEHGHIWYSITDNRLYVSFRATTKIFTQTFALSVVLDRWGIFSRSHIGMFTYGTARGLLAYADNRGIVSYIIPPVNQMLNMENPDDPGTFLPLDSEVLIGWIRAENLVPHADVIQEVQEVMVNKNISNLQAADTVYDEGFMTDSFVQYRDEGIISAYDRFILSAFDSSDVENWVSVPSVTGVEEDPVLYAFSPSTPFDENIVSDDEGLMGGIKIRSYALSVVSDLGILPGDDDGNEITPLVLARQNAYSDLWTGIVPTIYSRLRFEAKEMNHYFHVSGLDLTMAYSGNIS